MSNFYKFFIIFSWVHCRALARILKLPVILKRVPVKKKLMLLARHKSSARQCTSHHGWGPEARLRAPGGVQGAAPWKLWGFASLNALGELSWTSISNLLICIFMLKKRHKLWGKLRKWQGVLLCALFNLF